MYSYIKGIIEEISLDHVVIDNNGIGYKINASANTIMKLQLGCECKIYTKLIVKEDDMSLCGFYDKEELRMCELLTSISKIGPKVGLGILSFASPKQIGAYILSEDIGKLSKAPGVGKKTAERIVLELKDKIDKNNGTSTNTNGHGNYRVSYEDYMKNLNKIYKDETSTIEKDLKEGTITEDEAEKRLIKAAKAYSEEKEAADKYYGKDNQPEQKPEQKPEEDTSSSEWPNPKLKGTPYENMSKEEFLKFLREARKEAAIKQ